MLERKAEFDSIVDAITLLKSRGLTQEDSGAMAVSTGASRPGTPVVELVDGEDGAPNPSGTAEDGGERGRADTQGGSLNPRARPFRPMLGTPNSSRPGTPLPSSNSLPSSASSHLDPAHGGSTRGRASAPAGEDDIEMGEVAEERPQHTPPKKRTSKEDLEEGEDSGSDLTDLPEQYQ
jgi:hypothetical protein